MIQLPSPVVPFFSNPLLHRFLQVPENRHLFSQAVLEEDESSRLELERRFADYYYEMRFLGFIRKHIHYEALHLLGKCRTRQQLEQLLLNTPLSNAEDDGAQRIEMLEDPSRSVEEEVVGETQELSDITDDRDLHEAIQSLTQKQQTVLYMLYVEQLTEGEAAKLIGVSQQAINKVKRASLTLLRRKLGYGSLEKMVSRL